LCNTRNYLEGDIVIPEVEINKKYKAEIIETLREVIETESEIIETEIEIVKVDKDVIETEIKIVEDTLPKKVKGNSGLLFGQRSGTKKQDFAESSGQMFSLNIFVLFFIVYLNL
jgi:hypothetical protein